MSEKPSSACECAKCFFFLGVFPFSPWNNLERDLKLNLKKKERTNKKFWLYQFLFIPNFYLFITSLLIFLLQSQLQASIILLNCLLVYVAWFYARCTWSIIIMIVIINIFICWCIICLWSYNISFSYEVWLVKCINDYHMGLAIKFWPSNPSIIYLHNSAPIKTWL